MRPNVVFTVVFSKDGEFLAAPTVLGEFGCELCIEVPDIMRAQVPYRFVVMPRKIIAASPDGKYLAVSRTETVTKT